MISIDDFKKVEIKAGKIISAEPVAESEKLLKLQVDFGEEAPRQVISGIKKFVKPEDIIDKTYAFATNLEPREIMGLKSEAMILAVSGDDFFSTLNISDSAPPGSTVK